MLPVTACRQHEKWPLHETRALLTNDWNKTIKHTEMLAQF